MDTHVTETMETMGDVNARRDARRRRILENSERRLLKITGRDNNVESEGKRFFSVIVVRVTYYNLIFVCT